MVKSSNPEVAMHGNLTSNKVIGSSKFIQPTLHTTSIRSSQGQDLLLREHIQATASTWHQQHSEFGGLVASQSYPLWDCFSKLGKRNEFEQN